MEIASDIIISHRGTLARLGLTNGEWGLYRAPREKKEVQSGDSWYSQAWIPNPLVSLGLSFLSCTTGITVLPPSLGYCEDRTNS